MRKLAALQPAQAASSAYIRVLAPILETRIWCCWISVVAALHLVLAMAGFVMIECPFRQVFGYPCPGCGLTQAVIELIHGRWIAAVTAHALAPLFVVALLLVVLAAVLPEAPRRSIARAVCRFEQRSGAAMIAGILLVGYWAMRSLAG